jgi:hypothetical protein
MGACLSTPARQTPQKGSSRAQLSHNGDLVSAVVRVRWDESAGGAGLARLDSTAERGPKPIREDSVKLEVVSKVRPPPPGPARRDPRAAVADRA